MSNEENKPQLKRKRRRKRKANFGFLYLFAFVFLGALFLITNIIKSYSPDIDVTLGSNESLTLSDSDMDVEVKPIDERLKWIQMEDEMSMVQEKEEENYPNEIKDFDDIAPSKEIKADKEDKKKIKLPPKPEMQDIKKAEQKADSEPIKEIIPKPVKPTITKVYLGGYSSIEEAMSVQNKISSEHPSLMPFVKSVNNSYIVQLGSFSDSEKASVLVNSLSAKGYKPKIYSEK